MHTADGQEVGYVSSTAGSFSLSPGGYTIEIGGEQLSFSLKEGGTISLENK